MNQKHKRHGPHDYGDNTNPLIDMATAMDDDGATPSPYDMRLEIREPRRRQGSKARKKPGIYYLVVNGVLDEHPYSRDRAGARCGISRGPPQPSDQQAVRPHHAGQPDVLHILADEVATRMASARTNAQRRVANTTKHQAIVLTAHFGTMKLSSYRKQDSIDFKNRYVAEREAYYDSNPHVRRKNPEGTATQLLRLLRASTASYPGRHGLFWSLPIHVEAGDAREPARWLTRREVARLLLACRGWKWDRNRRRWFSKSKPKTRKARRWLARLIRFLIKTGSRHDVALAARWGSRAKSACVVIDAEGKGWIHRRGYSEIETIKGRPSMETLEELQFLLRGWAKEDGHIVGDEIRDEPVHEHIIHPPGGGYFSDYVGRQFADLCDDAGIEGATVHTLKHTAMSWANQRGITLLAAEQVLGTTAETLLKHYTHWGDESRRTGKQEFDDGASRRKLRRLHHPEQKQGERVRRADRPVRLRGGTKK